MKLSISNIALPSFNHERELHALAELGFTGLEVAPSKVWENVTTVSSTQVEEYRQTVESAGLEVVGLHSLFYDRPDLALFQDDTITAAAMDYLVHLSSICADLGGKTMVFGSGRARDKGDLSVAEADEILIDFLTRFSNRIEGHGTCLVIEALSAEFSNYIMTVAHAQRIIDAVDRPELQGHLDLAAAVAAEEVNEETLTAIKQKLAHVHVNEPGLVPLQTTGHVDHSLVGRLLKNIGYDGYCSLEQRPMNGQNCMAPINQSMLTLKEFYT